MEILPLLLCFGLMGWTNCHGNPANCHVKCANCHGSGGNCHGAAELSWQSGKPSWQICELSCPQLQLSKVEPEMRRRKNAVGL